jgi:hypothetical protein
MNELGRTASAPFSSECTQLQGQLHNVFRVLADPNHKLRDAAIARRHELSTKWGVLAAQGGWFPWPSTSASPGVRKLKRVDWPAHGMLSFLGYHVGEMQPTPQVMRWHILEFAFECHLPPLNGRDYYSEWGAPLTAQRLNKTVNTLAALARNAKRRSGSSWARAIEDWEYDLAFLYERYYVGFFHFSWPETNLLH